MKISQIFNTSDKTYSLVKVQTKNTIQLTKLTEVLCREKKRSDDLIYKLVPADIAKKLKNHIAVTPEIFDSVSGSLCCCFLIFLYHATSLYNNKTVKHYRNDEMDGGSIIDVCIDGAFTQHDRTFMISFGYDMEMLILTNALGLRPFNAVNSLRCVKCFS